MKVMVELPEKNYKELRNNFLSAECKSILKKAINKGVVIPDNATNGDVIKALFPYACFEEYEDECRHIVIMWADGEASIVRSDFEWDWWNAPYKGGQEDGKA